ncbi:MAG: hypothetical protein NC299_12190 [Lachnospiraceae bacterium]|nr:hypothetical protein [Ruminococcus sp.]MCM1276101.1 hypothetical protein [Lachnospiraceae bacterium]
MTKEKIKSAFLKCLPMLIVLVSTGVFMLAIKLVIGFFYEPKDTVYAKEYGGERFTVIQCYQTPASHYYLLSGDFVYDESRYKNAASEHDRAHMRDEPLAIFTLNETPLNMDNTVVKTLFSGNGLNAYQFGEFVIYRLEGEYGVFAPLREYKESATKRKNDLYVVRQMMKNERWKAFDLPTWETEEEFFGRLEKIEWYLDAEYED